VDFSLSCVRGGESKGVTQGRGRGKGNILFVRMRKA
jgi:hypothetical protein